MTIPPGVIAQLDSNARELESIKKSLTELQEKTQDLKTQRAELLTALRTSLGDQPTDQASRLAEQKLRLEIAALQSDGNGLWKFLKGLSLFSPGIALIIGILTILLGLGQLIGLQQQTEEQRFDKLLADVGAKERSIRMSSVSRLSTYSRQTRLGDSILSVFFPVRPLQEVQQQLVTGLIDALRIEPDLPIKQAILQLLEDKYSSLAAPGLRRLRYRLVVDLKNEGHSAASSAELPSARETLFYVGLAISNIERTPPDFRCFPFKGLRLRQFVLKRGARFDYATLTGAEFWGGSLQAIQLRKANLFGATIRDVDLSDASFQGAFLSGAAFGPGLVGLEAPMFKDSNWDKADWAEMQDFKTALAQAKIPIGSFSDKESDAYCSQLLNQTFGSSP